MRRTFLFRLGMVTRHSSFRILILGALFLWLPYPPSLSQAQAPPPPEPITPSGLGTQVNLSATPPDGNVQYDITGGTRPGGGVNLYHSFGNFNVPANNIANFLNSGSVDSAGHPLADGLPTDNILARVTDQQNPSMILGMIQTNGPGGFGNANLFLMNPHGFLFGPNSTVNVGGMLTFTTADYLRLADTARFNAIPDIAVDALLTASPIAAFGFLGSNPAAIEIEGSQLTVATGKGLSLIGGNITIGADPETGTPSALLVPSGQISLVSVASPGEVLFTNFGTGSNINGQSFTTMGTVSLTGGTLLDVSDNAFEAGGAAGSIRIRGGQFIMDSSVMLTNTLGEVDGENPGIRIGMKDDVLLTNLSAIATQTLGAGRSGDIEINARNTEIRDGSLIMTLGGGEGQTGQAGNIAITASESVSVIGTDEFGSPSQVISQTLQSTSDSRGDSGSIFIQAPLVALNDGGAVFTSAQAIGHAGDITLDVTNLSISGGGEVRTIGAGLDSSSGNITIRAADTVAISGQLTPDALSKISNRMDGTNLGTQGDVSINARKIVLADQGQIRSENFGEGGGGSGTVTLEAGESISMSSGASIVTKANFATVGGIDLSAPLITIDQATIFARSVNEFQGGAITLSGNTLTISNASQILSSTEQSKGQGGAITLAVSDSVNISGGSIIKSSAETFSEGPAGPVTVTAGNISLSGAGTGLFSEALGTGNGGSITVTATNQVTMTDGASISTSSTGPGNAGSIDITATNGFTMQNSTITTQAGQGASGGDIKVTTSPAATVWLQDSLISASVADGPGGGGNISIDPQFVILQNSQILAQAAQGQGGAITIIANLFLPDANSIVNADSGSGVNGTVTIQSPNAPVSGQIQPLNKTPLLATSLLNQRCAALAGGQFSSFTVAGRDSLPTEPGSWLASPLYAAGAGTGEGLSGLSSLSGVSDFVRAGLATHQIDQTNRINQTNPVLLSLRQIAPAGFLTQAFAVDRSAGCQS